LPVLSYAPLRSRNHHPRLALTISKRSVGQRPGSRQRRGDFSMSRKRPTIADLRAMKGKCQLTMLRCTTLEEAEAAERAGVDIVSITPEMILNPQYRDAAPSLFSMPGDNFFEFGTTDDFVRFAFRLYKASADAIYCAAGLPTIKRLTDDNIPIIGHVGLI